ncbi:hypothetical protein [Chamaesiphon sp. OTE_8_metabat_110]|uniref:hypothetical protein n=1 Tax=Chamaesiphon sp. OTE_8_metabat_110 TaxID=2964696 RepID=UPI00286C79B1|nr:hypothetical protein [Chamaesiphon sp. OTE_8_metabat_110]
MTLIRLIQRASILAGMTFASLPFYSNIAHADTPTPQFCVIASNGKTVCGTLKAVERACVTTNGTNTICGKFKSAKDGQEQGQEEARTPASNPGQRKELGGVTYVLRSCRRSSSDIKCNFIITAKKANKLNISTGKGKSSIVDSAGRTYPSSSLEYNGDNQNNIFTDMSPGVDYVVDINFENIPGQVTKASLLSIAMYAGSGVVQFRNVPFSN